MTVTVHFYSGDPDVYTGASYTIEGDVVTVTGTNAQGQQITVSYHWSDVKKVVQS